MTKPDESLTPLEAALIERLDLFIRLLSAEMKALRKLSMLQAVALWLLTVFTVAALIESVGVDSHKAARTAVSLSTPLEGVQ